MLHTWAMQWDTGGENLLSVTDPTNLTWSFTYTTVGGHLLTSVDPANYTQISATYNSFGQAETITTPAGATGTTTLTYKATTGDLEKIVDNSGSTVLMGKFDPVTRGIYANSDYDPLGDPLAVSVFPDTGNPATSNHPLTTSLVWDAAQRLTEIILPNGTRGKNIYTNFLLTRTEFLNPSGVVLSFVNIEYDTRGRVYRASDALGQFVRYTYNGNDQLKQEIDARGNILGFNYGPNGELTSTTGTNFGGTFQYDAVGRVRQSTDSRGITATYTYDNADRLQQIALTGHPSETTTYTYDDADRLLSVSKPNGDAVTFAYNHANKWLTGVTTMVGGRTHLVTYTYYPDGKRYTRQSSVGGVPKQTVTYTYNPRGQVDTLTVSDFGVTQYSYDYIGRPLWYETVTVSGGRHKTELEYGNTGQVSDTSTAQLFPRRMRSYVNNTLVDDWQMVYSFRGELLSLANATSTSTYTYDQRRRLIGETRSRTQSGTTYNGSSSYSYDAAGNLNAGTYGWSYSGYDNLLTSAPGNASSLPGVTGSITYTGGLVTQVEGKTLTYDAWGQLIQIAQSGGLPPPWCGPFGDAAIPQTTILVTYTYDPLGRKHRRQTGDGLSTTYYDYDGDSIIGQEDLGIPSGFAGNYPTQKPDVLLAHAVQRFSESVCSMTPLAEGLRPLTWLAAREPVQSGTYTRIASGPMQTLGAVFGSAIQVNRYTPAGNIQGVYNGNMNPVWQYGNGSRDAFNNNREPIGVGPTTPPTPLAKDGVYDSKDLGDLEDRAGASPSVGNEGPSLWQRAGGMGLSIAPGLGEAYGAWNAATGRDFVTGEKLNKLERMMEAASALTGPFGRAGKIVSRFCPQITKFARKVGIKRDFCFVAGTLVQVVENGKVLTKPIEAIQEGDIVVSRDAATGKTSHQKVLSTSERICQELFALHLADKATGKVVEAITATGEHPFFTPQGQRDARRLGIGTEIVTRAGPNLVVARVERLARPDGKKVYNFQVETTHTYFVGTVGGGAWGHNASPCQLVVDESRLKRLPTGRGIYYLHNKATGEKYIGSAENLRTRLYTDVFGRKPENAGYHKKAAQIFGSGTDGDIEITIREVDFDASLPSSNFEHGLRGAEQSVMDFHQMEKGKNGWINQRAAFTPAKFRKYRKSIGSFDANGNQTGWLYSIGDPTGY